MTQTDGTLSIHVNGEHRRVRAGIKLAELASELGLEPTSVAVERNLAAVPRSMLREAAVEDGDELDIVPVIGGTGS
jgi:thiazole synthase